MGLETGVTYIEDLVATNPVGATDNVDEGDDHIRNIKTAIQGSFPNLGSSAVILTAAEINNLQNQTITEVYDSGILTSAATILSITGLNLGPTESYKIIYSIVNALGSNSGYSLTANGADTLTDYYSQQFQVDDATLTRARNNNARISATDAGETTNGEGIIMLSNAKGFTVRANNVRNIDTNIISEEFSVVKAAILSADLTTLKLTASVANGIGVGSRFRIYQAYA